MFGSRPLSTLPLSTDLRDAPFNQTNWVNPPSTPKRDWAIASQVLGTAIVLITVFSTYVDRTPLIRRPDHLSQVQNTQPLGSAIALTSVVVAQDPLSKVSWPNPDSLKYPQQTQPYGSAGVLNVLVGHDALPKNQNYWPNPLLPRQPIQTQPIGSWSELIRDTNIYAPRTPLIRRIDALRQPVQTQPLGSPLAINTVVVAQAPFSKTDWPNPTISRQPQQTQLLGSSVPQETQYLLRRGLSYNYAKLKQPDQTQPLGLPAALFPVDTNVYAPRVPLVRRIDAIRQPVQTQPLGSNVNITTVPPVPYLMCQLDWPNPQIPRQPYQINTWNVPLSILVTIPVPEPVDLTDTHDGGPKRRHEHERKRKKLIDDERERNELRRAQVIAVFEQVIEGKVSRETNKEQVIAVAEEIVESASKALNINTKSDAEFASLLSDLDKLARILDDYFDADDEDVLVLL